MSKLFSLGEKFGLPFDPINRSDRKNCVLESIKNIEANSFRIRSDKMDDVRMSVVNSIGRNFSNNRKVDPITNIYWAVECNKFLRNNEDILVTRADKGQVTVIMKMIRLS